MEALGVRMGIEKLLWESHKTKKVCFFSCSVFCFFTFSFLLFIISACPFIRAWGPWEEGGKRTILVLYFLTLPPENQILV